MRQVVSRTIVPVVFLIVCALPVRAQSVFRGWVALYGEDQLAWLSNEYRLDALCPEPSTAERCRAEMMEPSISAYELRTTPDERAESLGVLTVVATPSEALEATWRGMGSEESSPFEPDLYLADWGYGPYFHQTFRERRGAWFLLPPGPWPAEAWLRRETESDDDVLAVFPEEIVEMDGDGWVVVASEAEALTMRPEQEGDMWCQAEEPPAIRPVEPTRFPRERLLDERGHLKVRPKYMKGC